MPWLTQLITAVFMVIFYIAVFIAAHATSNLLVKGLYYSLGAGMFGMLFLIFWMFQYSIHHTILYWRIVELFK